MKKLFQKIKLARNILILLFLLLANVSFSAHLLIPMDDTQKNHLKAYGIAYWTLQNEIEVKWLLNYRGGSFLMQYFKKSTVEIFLEIL